MSDADAPPFAESSRPSFHFTAPRNWLNDPNGLVYTAGRYHLFYQHNPHANSFGTAHWGHASSDDLVVWEHHPIALEPDNLGAIFSGSAVVDHRGDAGLGRGAIVAAFTHHRNGTESQSLAFSTDEGATWQKYAGNPVLTAPEGERDFRDPRVIWWQGADGGHWVMLLAVGVAVWIYTSDDLIAWTRASVFAGNRESARVWECPDLVELPVDGTSERRSVLAVSVDTAGLDGAGPNGTRYFIGDFDGAVFTASHDDVRWADHGADFYAAQSWNEAPGGRALWIGWMSNWLYAGDVPTVGWRGALTIPRELGLRAVGDGIRLTQQPIAELERWLTPVLALRDVELVPRGLDPLAAVRGTALDIAVDIDVRRSRGARVRLAVRVGAGELTEVVVDLAAGTVEVNRCEGGGHPLHRSTGALTAALPAGLEVVDVRVLVDTSSVELFAAGGTIAITDQVFATPSSDGLRLVTEGATAVVSALSVRAVDPRG